MKEKLEISQKKLVEFYESLLKGENKNIDDQKKFLLQLITTKIDQIDTKEVKNEKYFKNFKISILIISSTLSFILGMKDIIVPLKNDITLFLSVIISLLTGLLTFLNYEKLWIRYKVILNNLKELRYEYTNYLYKTDKTTEQDPTTKEKKDKEDKEEMKKFLEKFLNTLGDDFWENYLKTQK
jgi:Protein of unknown function (DUF4231)